MFVEYYKSNCIVMNNDDQVNICYVKNLPLNYIHPRRGGVILYTLYNNVVYIGLGVDAPTHDLTDFAGTITYNSENALEGALREFNEETLGIFKEISYDSVLNCLAIYGNNDLIVFIPIECNPNDISRIFNQKYNLELERIKLDINNTDKRYYPEICSITWLTLNEFIDAISQDGHNILYHRVKKFLFKCIDTFGIFFELL